MENESTMQTWSKLSAVPDDVFTVYRTDTMFGTTYGDLEYGILSLKLRVKVTPYVKHSRRGWEAA